MGRKGYKLLKEKVLRRVALSRVRLCEKIVWRPDHVKVLRQMAQPLELIPSAASITDPLAHRFIYVNPAWVRVYGFSVPQALGERVAILNLPEVSKLLLNKIAEGTRQGGWQGRLLNRNRKGEIFPVHLRTRSLLSPTGEAIGLLGIVTVLGLAIKGLDGFEPNAGSKAKVKRARKGLAWRKA